jgi:phenylalanyl-tRNA synthetase beta chain
LFEVGSTFWVDAGGKVDERRRVGLVGSSDYREVRGAVEVMLESLDAAKATVVAPDERAGFATGACGRVEWGGRAVGYVGKVERAVAEKLGLRETPFAAELELEPLIAGARWLPQVKELAKFPAVKRDLSLVVAEKVRYEEIAAVVRELRLPNLEDVEYVTTYRGKQLGEGNKSVTVELVFRGEAGTLTGEEVEGSVRRVVGAAKERVGADLRV